MDVPNVLSNYNLLALGLSYFTCISCWRYLHMFLVEVVRPLSFGLSLGWKLRNSMGLF